MPTSWDSLRGRTVRGAPCRLPRTARGFTLIELVAVLVIVGVLAVVAVPRFVDLRADSHRAVVNATAGAFASAVALAQAACRAKNWAGQPNMPGYAGNLVDFTAGCYPSDTSGSTTTTMNGGKCVRVWNGILVQRPTIATTATADYQASGAGNTCTYVYRRNLPTNRRFTYNVVTGAVTVTSNP